MAWRGSVEVGSAPPALASQGVTPRLAPPQAHTQAQAQAQARGRGGATRLKIQAAWLKLPRPKAMPLPTAL